MSIYPNHPPRPAGRWAYSYWRLPYHQDYAPCRGGLLEIDYVTVQLIHNGDRPYSVIGLDHVIRVRAQLPFESQFRDFFPRFVAGGVILQPLSPPRVGVVGMFVLHPDNFWHMVQLANVRFVDYSFPGLETLPPNPYELALAHYWNKIDGATVRAPYWIDKYWPAGLPPAPPVGVEEEGVVFNFGWGNVAYEQGRTRIDFPWPPSPSVETMLERDLYAWQDTTQKAIWYIDNRIEREVVDAKLKAADSLRYSKVVA